MRFPERFVNGPKWQISNVSKWPSRKRPTLFTAPRYFILSGRASAPGVVEWELERGGKTEPAKALCRSRSWHQPPTQAGSSARTSPRPGAGRWGLDGLVVIGWSVEQETPVLHALEAAASARAVANRQQVLEDGDYEASYAAGT
jgi:hypothetical protein